MSRMIGRPGLLLMIGLAASEPAGRAAETPGLLATQVTIAIERGRSRRQFRATVMAIRDDTLTILTAAHCLSSADEAGPALLLHDGEVVEGTVLAVARNPAYREAPGPDAEPGGQAPRRRAAPSRELPGPDNAVARIRFKPAAASKPAEAAFRSIRAAEGLAARSYPRPEGQTVSVRLIDGHNVEHAVRAGNYGNPRWLEWGTAYKPIPGDSGGGVFVIHAGADGQARPILIGVIVGSDDRGGGASLVARDYPWIAEALASPR